MKRKIEQGIIRIADLEWTRVGMLGRHQVGRSLDGCLENIELDSIDRRLRGALKVIKQGRGLEEGKLMLPFLLS